MKVYIKNMVSICCKMVVIEELKKIGVDDAVVNFGEVEFPDAITDEQFNEFRTGLFRFGLMILDNKKTLLIDKIKSVIIELVHYEAEPLKMNFSAYLSRKLNYEYTYLANLFSETEGINVEHYLITHKIERVKELLVYEGLTLTEISYKLNYSSVAHLCNQFKKITGTTPSNFKKSRVEHYLQTA